MAESKDNIITKGLRGSIGGQLVFKKYGNRTIVTKMPNMKNVVKSEKQKKENSKFSEAIAFARSQMCDPESKALYKAKARDLQKPHNVAISDFYNAPEIRDVDTNEIHSTGIIHIYAWDDFKVEKVLVEIYSQEGKLVESGEASEVVQWSWSYRVKMALAGGEKIKVSAWDRPLNLTIKEVFI